MYTKYKQFFLDTLKSAKEKTKQAEETSNVDYDTDDSSDYRDMETRKIRFANSSKTYFSFVKSYQKNLAYICFKFILNF